MGVLYILDEPSIGLHPRDNNRLLTTLKKLRDLGNSVIVVEHDRETMEASDYIIDIGPGAGTHGGKVVYAGVPKEILNFAYFTILFFFFGRSTYTTCCLFSSINVQIIIMIVVL